MTLTILSDSFVTRIAIMLLQTEHPRSDWMLYPTMSQAKRQARYEVRATEIINAVVDEYNRLNKRSFAS